jgi:hypothetical protein
MNLTTFSFLPLFSTHTHAFNAHSSNTKNMAMKQWHVVEISKRQLARLISDKHLPTFLLNSWVLGIMGFWDTFNIERGGKTKKWKTQKKKLKRRKNKKMKENTKFNNFFFFK